jgi:O-antigen/teichoic acid export membrane protein
LKIVEVRSKRLRKELNHGAVLEQNAGRTEDLIADHQSVASRRLRDELLRLLHDSVVYGFVRYLAVLSGIILTPIYTRLLTKEDYGTIEICVTWMTLSSMVIPLGLPTALQRFYPDVVGDALSMRKVIGTIHVIVLATASAYAILLSPFPEAFLRVFSATAAPREVFYLSIVAAVLTSYLSILLSLHQAAGRKYHFAWLSLLNFAVSTLLGFGLVYWLGQGVTGFFRASIIGLVLTLGVGLFVTKEAVAIGFDPAVARRLLTYSLPVVWVFLLFQGSIMLDRFFITRFLSLSEAGVFSVANKIAGVLSLAISAITMAWFPYAMGAQKTPEAKVLYAKAFSLYVAGSAILVSVICLFRADVIRLVAPGYTASYGPIAVLCFYYAAMGSVYFLTVGLHISEQTKHIASAGLASVAVNVVASVVLVQVIGLEGIAYGSLLGAVVWIIPQLRKAQTLYRIQFSYQFCVESLGIVVVVAYGGPYLDAMLRDAPSGVRLATSSLVLVVIVAATCYGCMAELRRLGQTVARA